MTGPAALSVTILALCAAGLTAAYLLPTREGTTMRFAKSLVQLAMTILAAIIPAVAAGPLDAAAWINVVVLGAGVVVVWNTSNDVPGWGWAKMVASGVVAVAAVLTAAITDGGISLAEVFQMVLAAAAVAGVGAVPNGQPEVIEHA